MYYHNKHKSMNNKRSQSFVTREYKQYDGNDRQSERVQKNQVSSITINDIIEYIESNTKFIKYSKSDDVFVDSDSDKTIAKLKPLDSGNSAKLEIPQVLTNLNDIFNKNILFRYGTISNVGIPSEVDISLVSSVMSIIIPDFLTLKTTSQIEFIEIFVRKLNQDSRANYELFKYEKLGWTVKEFVNNVRDFILKKDLMRYIADLLNINLFIVDMSNDNLVYVGDKVFIKYKKNVFVLRLDDTRFEPLILNSTITKTSTNFMDYKSNIIKKLLQSQFLVERMDCDLTHETEEFNFVVGKEDLTIYIDKTDDIIKPNIDDKNDKEPNEEHEKLEKIKVTEKELNKLSLATLKDKASELDIKLTYKKNGKITNKTKIMLIDEIIKKP